MKVAVSAMDKELEAQLDPRFGRACCFLLVDTETGDCCGIPNEASGAAGGAGIQAAQTVVGEGVETVITGNVGPNAMDVLQAAGVKVYGTGPCTVKEALEKLQKGSLEEITAPKPRHYGAGRGRGRG